MKIVIIVLIIISLIFIGFVVRGALREDPEPPRAEKLKEASKDTPRPGWAEKVQGLFSSMKPTLKLKNQFYSGPADEKIPADDKQPFRTGKFLWQAGKARITYKDLTFIEPNSPLRKLQDQECILKGDPDEVPDVNRCSIVAMKGGGTFKFECLENASCRVKVE